MLTENGLREGRVRVNTPAEYIEHLKADGGRQIADERWIKTFDITLSGLCQNGAVSFPYPGYYGTTGQAVMLRRDQAEHLAATLLRKLAPGGELPTDAAEMLDFVAALLHSNP